MKVLRNKVCFVEVDDLVRCPIPSFINMIIWINNGRFAAFIKEEEIEYFRNRKDIVDYDEVCNLTNEELNNKIKELHTTLSGSINEWLNVSNEKSIENYQNIKNYTSLYDSLLNYSLNREKIDSSVSDLEKKIESDDIKVLPMFEQHSDNNKVYQEEYVKSLLKAFENNG